jgi:hypothetical protein
MYTLHNTFSNSVISRHRTIFAAVRAKRAHARAVTRRNGPNSYIPYAITGHDDKRVPIDEIHDAEDKLNYSRWP